MSKPKKKRSLVINGDARVVFEHRSTDHDNLVKWSTSSKRGLLLPAVAAALVGLETRLLRPAPQKENPRGPLNQYLSDVRKK